MDKLKANYGQTYEQTIGIPWAYPNHSMAPLTKVHESTKVDECIPPLSLSAMK